MATVTSIVTALQAALDTLSVVDQSSISDYEPPITTQSVALCIVPFSQETSAEFEDLSGAKLICTHRILCEFWVKYVAGSVAATQQKARELAQDAIKALAQNDGTGYTLSFDFAFEAKVDDDGVQVGNGTYLKVVVNVPVRNEESV